jgi:hypothetical protein
MTVFHLAIPCVDLDAATKFYCGVLQAKAARRYPDRQTFNLFGHQLVCHLERAHTVPQNPLAQPYPRHFGMTLQNRAEIETLWAACQEAKVEHLSKLTWRFKEKPERHLTFWAADPSGEILEFKWYEDARFIY